LWPLQLCKKIKQTSKTFDSFFLPLQHTSMFASPKKVLKGIKKAISRVSNNSLLKYRRQFYIRNHILFLNYPNHYYIFFLSYIFASGIISYSLFFVRPSTFRLTDKHARREKICATWKCVTLHGIWWFFSSSKRLGEWIRSFWRGVFSHLVEK
jgi:hypothetical protein